MTRRRRTKPIETRQSLTAAGVVRPDCWQITHEEAAQALEIPVDRIVKVVPRRYQVCIVYIKENGKKCSSFFSYRRFSRFLREVEVAINSIQNLQTLEYLAQIVEYDLCHFRYHRVKIGNGIRAALLQRLAKLSAVSRYQAKSA